MDLKQNYFEIFGLPIAFEVDLELLAERYLELQKEVHPDNFAAGSDHEKRLSMQYTALVNQANETLSDGLKRAVYLLSLKGIELAHNPVLPPEFLMKQISLREELEEIESDASIESLDQFKAEVRGELGKIESVFAGAVGGDPDLDKATEAAYELQFLNKLMVEADHLEEKLLDY